MEYFKKIKLDIPWINPAYDIVGLQRKCEIFPIHKIFQLDINALNPTLVDWFGNKGILIKAYIFLTPPLSKSLIHIDGDDFHECWALNWAWGNDQHEMHWYTLNDQVSITGGSTRAGTTYKSWNENEVVKIASTKIDTPTICKIGVPHQAENYSTLTRWSISIRPQVFTKWDRAMSVFSNEIKEYENGC